MHKDGTRLYVALEDETYLRRYDYGNYDYGNYDKNGRLHLRLSGTVAAVLRKEWQSKIMREGLLHKCSLLLCVVLGVVLDMGQHYLELGISIPAYKCISAYITLMEAGSMIENVCKINPGLAPKKLRAVLGLATTEDDKEDN